MAELNLGLEFAASGRSRHDLRQCAGRQGPDCGWAAIV